jgi:hypothetical protein
MLNSLPFVHRNAGWQASALCLGSFERVGYTREGFCLEADRATTAVRHTHP